MINRMPELRPHYKGVLLQALNVIGKFVFDEGAPVPIIL